MKTVKGILFVIVFVLLAALTVWIAVQAVAVFRDGRTEEALVFAVGAFFVGMVPATMLLVVFLVRWAERKFGDTRQGRADHPEEPWLWRREWAERRIEHLESRAGLVLVWGFALLWLAVTLGSAALVHQQSGLDNEPGVVIFLLVFLAAGLFLLSLAFRATVRRSKYGRSVLELETLPGVIGGEFRGVIRAPSNLAPDAEVHLALDCIRVLRRRGQSRSGTSHHLEWRCEKTLALGGMGGAIPVSLEIPYDCPETIPEDLDSPPGTRVKWNLKVSARTPGVDYAATFDVPVFKTADSDPAKLKGVIAADDATPADPPVTRITILPMASGGTAITYPKPGWLAPWLLASTVPVAVAGIVAWLSDHKAIELLSTLGVGAAISVAILGIALLGLVMQPMRVEIRPDTVAVKRGVRPLGWTKRIPRSVITEITFDSLQSGSKMHYTIDAKTASGSSYTVALGLRTVEETRWLAAQLMLLLGISQKSPQ